MAQWLQRVGIFAARRAWAVLVTWLVLLGLAGGAFALWSGSLSGTFEIPGTASGEVIEELEGELPELSGATGTVVLTSEDGPLTEEQQSEIGELVAGAADLTDVAAFVDPFATQEQLAGQVAEMESGGEEIAAGQAALDEQRAALESQGEAPAAALEELDAQQAELDAQAEQLALGGELLEMADGMRMVSEDGTTALVTVSFTESRMELPDASREGVVEYIESHPIDGVRAELDTNISQGVPQVLGVGEVIGVAIAGVVLVIVLGSALAASFPIVTAVTGVGIGALSTLSLSGVVTMSSVTPVFGVMLGLAVGIDYSLFILNRHREQLIGGSDVRASIGLANGTAGTAVVFAGSTVVLALLALNVVGIPFLGVMGSAGAVSIVVAVLLAVTATPALLGLAGTRVLGKKARVRREAALAATGRSDDVGGPGDVVGTADAPAPGSKPVRAMSTGRAVVTVLVTALALLVVAIPALSMRLGLPGGESEPADSTGYRAYEITEEQFGAGQAGTILVAAHLPEGVTEEEVLPTQVSIARELHAQDSVASVAPISVSEDRRLAAFQVIPEEGPNSVSTTELVHDLRALPPVDGEIELGISGQAAINIDISDGLADALPVYLAVVVGLSFLIMMTVFRSLLVPLVATAGFVLSLFATFGVVTAVVQWGWGAELLGFNSTGPLLSFLPVIVVGVLFGLAMDYQLFLSTGMREAFVHGSPARLAVAEGFRAGRRVVTAAALIMIAVFGGFITSESAMIKSFGIALAVGVALDAFVVRMLLMPAVMHLLGRSAWWLPRWLDKILPDVDVEGSSLREPVEPSGSAQAAARDEERTASR